MTSFTNISTATFQTLQLFVDQHSDLISSGGQKLFVRPTPNPGLDQFAKQNFCFLQTFRPHFDWLAGRGYAVSAELSGSYSSVVYLPTNQKDENLYNFARALEALEPGGHIICSMHNQLGAARFEKKLAELCGQVESFSKHRCRVFWTVKNSSLNTELKQAWLQLGKLQKIPEIQLYSRPGIFGWNKVDSGSSLLCQLLPEKITGHGADLGCGYGYLSNHLISYYPGITSLQLYDSELLAIEAARMNLSGKPQVDCHWADVVKGINEKNLDFIIMNPPFHQGKETKQELGYSFVREAARALRTGGRLFMVGNSHLAYPRILKDNFSQVQILAERHGYQVFEATK